MPSSISSRTLRRLALAVAALVLLVFAAVLAVPWWVSGQGMKIASQALGREVSVAVVRFQPWRLGLVMEGLKVAGQAPADPALLEVGRLDVALSTRSLWHRGLILSELQVLQPVLRLARVSEGHYDIDDLLARWGKPSAEPAADGEGDPPVALYNLRLSEGQVLLDDKPVGRRHEISGLQLDLPFVSLLDADIAVHVEPHLAGRLNGIEFGSKAQALPFAETRKASLDFSLKALDLAPYLAYWPKTLPLAPQRGQLSAELKLVFEQAPGKTPSLKLSGDVGARDIALALGDNKSWLVWQDLRLGMKDVQPLARRVQLGSLVWSAPAMTLHRDAAGRLLLPQFAPAPAPKTPAKTAAASPPWAFSLDSFEVRQAQLGWRDASLRPAVGLAINEFDLKLAGVHWPMQAKTTLNFSGRLLTEEGKIKPARLSGNGELTAQELALTAQWQDLALEWLSPYVEAQLPLAVQGSLAGQANLTLSKPLADDAGKRLKLGLRELKLDGLQARQLLAGGQRHEVLSLKQLSLDEATLDPSARRVTLGRLNVQAPRMQLQRAADGQLNVQALLPAKSESRSDSQAVPAPTAAAWDVQLAALAVDQGALQWTDAVARPVAGSRAAEVSGPYVLLVDQLRLRAENVGRDRAPLQLSLQLGRPSVRRGGAVSQASQGRLQWQGDVSLAPLALRGTLRAERLPLQALDPYLDPALGVHLRRAEAGFRGQVALSQEAQGLQARAQGDLLLGDLRLMQASLQGGARIAGEDLLRWQALNLSGLLVELQPSQPLRVEMTQASLSEFYARLVINEQGRFNLGEVGPKAERAPAVPAASASATANAKADAPALRLKVGQTQLVQGSVDFTDNFIRPNYSAQLTELQGSLGTFASGQTQMAPLTVKGKVAGTGLLDIGGELNPAGAPLQMNIKASATDIELAPLSPYAGKYAGFAIDRGKLSTHVHYRIAADGQLQADNQVILNQLTFGERIDSPDATKLPVRLAVSLLEDRNGVIDINLPISGSINDPQFSIGGLIGHVIVNLLGKALTSPFSLLAGGGSSDLSEVEFAAGSTVLAEAANANVDKLAKALIERPTLNLTITGWADPAAEQAAVQALKVEQSLVAERRRELRRQQNAAGQAPAEQPQRPIELSPAERQRLLKLVYENSSLSNRPRNMIGLLKEVPAEQMQAMLAASYPVGEEALRQLALERGVSVRDALIAKGVPNARLFLASPKLHQATEAGKGWTPHAALSLATK
jgi:uncharacterized protein involved in outer membrane biogenesis